MTVFLNDNTFYMEPNTGDVMIAEDWEESFFTQNDFDTWHEWRGDTLISVKKNENGEWVED